LNASDGFGGLPFGIRKGRIEFFEAGNVGGREERPALLPKVIVEILVVRHHRGYGVVIFKFKAFLNARQILFFRPLNRFQRETMIRNNYTQ
jgi:hypothetical protein